MNIIAIDSITPVLSISAKGPLGTATLAISDTGQHAGHILTLTDSVLSIAGFRAIETNLVLCPEGPGSFTGLRLAWSTSKAIQLASQCILQPIPTLACYALEFSQWPGAVISVIDAKKNRFYVQVYRRGINSTDSLDISPSEITTYVDREERILITGPDSKLFASLIEQEIPNLDISISTTGANGISHNMLLFAEKNFTVYTKQVNDYAGPKYVRKSDAETNTTKP